MCNRNCHNQKNALLILTSQSMLTAAAARIRNREYAKYRIDGIALLDGDHVGEQIEGIRIIANGDTVINYICRQWVDEVLIDLPSDERIEDRLLETILLMGVTVHIRGADEKELTMCRYPLSRRQELCKRALDVAGSMVGCLCTVFLTLILSPIIFLKSPGPVFFSQIRIGKNGRRFKMYKFRSMYVDAEERKQELMDQNLVKGGYMFKIKHDPRIIGGDHGIGSFIRRYSIDEFPQFWNVLRGDMSLVGTRPPTPDEWERYEPHHRVRLAMKPGITGMWQVSGRNDVTDFEEVVKLDTEYISNWSMWTDIKILVKTLFVIFWKRGAM